MLVYFYAIAYCLILNFFRYFKFGKCLYSRGYVAEFFVNQFITRLVQNMEDRNWMYDRVNPHRRGLKREFIEGVDEFVRKAKELPYYASD